MLDLDSEIQYLKGIGPKRAEMFQRLGVKTISDLLYFFPRKYEDWSANTKIIDAPNNLSMAIRGIVCYEPLVTKLSSGKILVKTAITDGTASLEIVFFNNGYIAEKLQEGAELIFYGKITDDGFGLRQMVSPEVSPQEIHGLVPIYPQTAGLNSKQISKTMRTALDLMRGTITETLPDYLIEKYRLPSLYSCIEKMHFPENQNEAKIARRRLVFEELLVLELSLLRLQNHTERATMQIISKNYTDEFIKSLPFTLTKAQERSIDECLADMRSGFAMNRLLQGDVGSGKTAVAATLIYSTIKNGFTAALMAPTEVLATQHYATFQRFFANSEIKIQLLTGSLTAKEKREIKEGLLKGETELIIGTHALIQKDVEIPRLGLVVTDEQHRFGVRQREELTKKGLRPHGLVMSATPIPRTLAMMIYGDLNVSILDELPPGRMPIDTLKVESNLHKNVYNFTKSELDKGRQAYIICPLVEENDSDLTAVTDYFAALSRDEFALYQTAMLHGRMKPKEKEQIMADFSAGKIQILFSTVVVEVGVDVPNATIMIIENAERFGLSQLHQLRGRIGRGQHKSYCILVSDAQNEEATARLQKLCETGDGFEIAEFDLKQRGPGDFFGSRQHGLPEMKLADFMTDAAAITATQKIAKEIYDDFSLDDDKNARLKAAVLKKMESYEHC